MRLRNYKIKSKGVKKYVRNRIFIFSGSDTVIAHQMFEKIVQDYLNHGDSVISNKLNNEHRPENQRPQQKTKWQSPETKIIHPAEPSMQERFNRAWKKVNDEEAAAGETDEGALEGAVKCMMEK